MTRTLSLRRGNGDARRPQFLAPLAEKTSRRGCIFNKTQLEAARSLSRQQKLDLCVAQISRSEGVPPFCDHANEIMVRTLDLDGGSHTKLVEVILRDVGLASQVLRLANSAMHNQSGRPIMSVAHAITVLGWLEVRSMASAVRYIEHFANRSPGLRELVLTSVLTAVLSREVATVVGYPHPGEAYICGLFRNLGEVLIACNFPEEHSRIIVLMDQEHILERAACSRVLDYSWDDVGLRVAAFWNMPPAVRLPMGALSTAAASPLDRCLASLTNYSHKLTRALYRKGISIDKVHLETVLNPAGGPVLISVRQLYSIVDLAMAETKDMFSALQIPTETLRMSKQAEQARKALEPTAVE
ncbi:MAG: HDOD domain-containing protein [Thiobacillaceae bacterium]